MPRTHVGQVWVVQNWKEEAIDAKAGSPDSMPA